VLLSLNCSPHIPSIPLPLLCRLLPTTTFHSSCFLGTDNLSTTAVGWCCPWVANIFRVFLSNFRSYSVCQLIINTVTATDSFACIFFALNSLPKINLKLPKYSFFSVSFSFLSQSHDSLPSLNTYTRFSGPSFKVLLISISYVRFLLNLTLKKFLAHFCNPRFILMSLLIIFTLFFYFQISSPLSSNLYSSIYSERFIFLSVLFTRYPQSALFNLCMDEINAIHHRMTTVSPPGVFLFLPPWISIALLLVLFLK
jgi:hypothetical protein